LYLVDELGDKDDGGDDTRHEADGPDHDVERGQRHPFVTAGHIGQSCLKGTVA
jgi:hypothetical protein